MVTPRIIAREHHTISRQQIDPDALKVMNRLRQYSHTAYLVGGGVRDLLLKRTPKDFDIGTSAHPNEVKKIFRNCWVVGRRFRLAHVKFGRKTIEVATFRQQGLANSETASDSRLRSPIARDNTFGSPEEDAFRRDFTINGLFYDVGTLTVIDYVGGTVDLQNRLIRCIGDPNERFVEDPVRMLRAVLFAERLSFRLDTPIRKAIDRHHQKISQAAPARLLEELYKILRSGVARKILRSLSRKKLLQHIAPEIELGQSAALWRSLDRLDAFRRGSSSSSVELGTPVLLGSVVVPITETNTRRRRSIEDTGPAAIKLGQLPIARRDIERLSRIVALQVKLIDATLPPRSIRGVLARHYFRDALNWFTIHRNEPDVVKRWTTLANASGNLLQNTTKKPRKRLRRRRRYRDQIRP